MAWLTRISPASAVASIRRVWLDARHAIISSRCDPPTRKRLNVSLWTPTDIREVTCPATVSQRLKSRSAWRISTAA